ncbi:hypothetical protein KC19_12G045400 [Ceratodon purpureus]|uniref:Uncharacterized protein n=1 Tax=Ceratodon purpureus TaxID=3225 RepID=A0A8T0G489_CERPU|nr:hypothetical protein KC19_12G045400 [Ceratodon purpureus]
MIDAGLISYYTRPHFQHPGPTHGKVYGVFRHRFVCKCPLSECLSRGGSRGPVWGLAILALRESEACPEVDAVGYSRLPVDSLHHLNMFLGSSLAASWMAIMKCSPCVKVVFGCFQSGGGRFQELTEW